MILLKHTDLLSLLIILEGNTSISLMPLYLLFLFFLAVA